MTRPATLAEVFARAEVEARSLPAQLRAIVASDPRPDAEIARAADMAPEALSRLLREDKPRDGRLSSYVRLAEALGCRLALERAGGAP